MAAITTTWDVKGFQQIVKKLRVITFGWFQKLNAICSNRESLINKFDRSCVVAKYDNRQIAIESHRLVINVTTDEILPLVDNGHNPFF